MWSYASHSFLTQFLSCSMEILIHTLEGCCKDHVNKTHRRHFAHTDNTIQMRSIIMHIRRAFLSLFTGIFPATFFCKSITQIRAFEFAHRIIMLEEIQGAQPSVSIRHLTQLLQQEAAFPPIENLQKRTLCNFARQLSEVCVPAVCQCP